MFRMNQTNSDGQILMSSLFGIFDLLNSTDPDEKPPYVAFHLGLNFLSKY